MSDRKEIKCRKALYLSVFAILAVLMLVIEIFQIKFSDDKTVHDIVYAISTRAIGSVICVMMMIYCSFGNLFSLRGKLNIKKYLLILPFWIVAINNFPFIGVINEEVTLVRGGVLVFLYAIQCFLTGLFEETAFRGCVFMLVLQGRRKTRADVFWSIIISSAIFGVTHIVNLFVGAGIAPVIRQLGYSFLIGAMCSVALILTKEIWSCVFLHAVFNFAGGVMPTLGKGSIWNLPTVILTAVIAVVVAVYGVAVFLKLDLSELDCFFEKEKLTLDGAEND